MSKTILHLDLETTGLNHYVHAIHRIAGMVEVDGDILAKFDYTVKPHAGARICEQALKVGKITFNDLQRYDNTDVVFRRYQEVVNTFVSADPTTRLYVCAYNGGALEIPFLRHWYMINGSGLFRSHYHSGCLDTLAIATNHFLTKGIYLANHKLSTVAKHLGIEVDKTRLHDPFYDAELSRNIFHAINKK